VARLDEYCTIHQSQQTSWLNLTIEPDTSGEIVLSSGSGSATITGAGNNEITITMSEAEANACLSITVNGIEDLDGNTLVGGNNVYVAVLKGDANGSGIVSIQDLSYVKSRLSGPLSNENFRADIDTSGTISIQDLSAVKSNLFQSVSCP